MFTRPYGASRSVTRFSRPEPALKLIDSKPPFISSVLTNCTLEAKSDDSNRRRARPGVVRVTTSLLLAPRAWILFQFCMSAERLIAPPVVSRWLSQNDLPDAVEAKPPTDVDAEVESRAWRPALTS